MINIFTLIEKKKQKQELTKQEIDYFVNGYTKTNAIPDYQASAFLMAICLNGLNKKETFLFTDAYIRSGKTYDYKKHFSPIIDKHSLGGVGDKVSLIFAPIVSALGIGVAKISGKGLGWTGGTIDKCNSIGINCNISKQQAINSLKKNKMFITMQTQKLVPADKKIYDLRNATGTVNSDGLIGASVVSKKLAIKTDYVYLDVKIGDGALIEKYDDALRLSKLMLSIFKNAKRKAAVHITDMSQPLGRSIGNALEVKASLECLLGKWEDQRTKKLIYEFVSDVLLDFKMCKDKVNAYKKIDEVINSKKAYNQFINWASTNGANKQNITGNFFKPKYTSIVKAKKSGYIYYKSTKVFGMASLEIGVGKKTIASNVDFMAGIYLNKISNEKVNKGDTIISLYSSKPISPAAIEMLETNIDYLTKPKKLPPIVHKVLHN